MGGSLIDARVTSISYDTCSNKYKLRIYCSDAFDLEREEVPVIQTTTASKVSGGLLIFSAIFGLLILGTDSVLRGASAHYFALIGFVILDIAVGILVIARPTKMAFSIAIGWSLLRIILQIADITQASTYQFSSYGQFADYLFNPGSGLAVSLGNPPGVPAALIDLIMIIEIAVTAISWKARSGQARS